MIICFMGPEGSGKGTQASLLAKKLQLPHIVTGELFMALMHEDSELGRKVKAIREAGKYVDDETVIAIFKNRISQTDCVNGFIADGYPRSIGQAQALDQILASQNKKLDYAVLLTISEVETLRRLSGRGRFDDTPENIKARLVTYHSVADAMVTYYRTAGNLIEINAEKPVEMIQQTILETLHVNP